MQAAGIETVLPEFLRFCKGSVLVAHNAGFDMSFIMENADRLGLGREFTYMAKHTLDAVAKALGVSLENHHRAVDDAEATAEIFVRFLPMLRQEGVDTLAKLNALGASSPDIVKRLPSYHAIILAKNNIGRENLYTLVSDEAQGGADSGKRL